MSIIHARAGAKQKPYGLFHTIFSDSHRYMMPTGVVAFSVLPAGSKKLHASRLPHVRIALSHPIATSVTYQVYNMHAFFPPSPPCTHVSLRPCCCCCYCHTAGELWDHRQALSVICAGARRCYHAHHVAGFFSCIYEVPVLFFLSCRTSILFFLFFSYVRPFFSSFFSIPLLL